MQTIKGPGLFISQFISDKEPFNSLEGICKWASSLGFKAVQLPTLDKRFIDLQLAAESKDYADELKGKIASYGLEISELSTHLQGQLIAVHPVYNDLFDGFAPKELHKNPKARQEWAVQQLHYAAKASKNLGLDSHVTFSGSFLWPLIYPWPQRPSGVVEEGFTELAKRWTPILNAFDEQGIDLCYEIHAGEDLHDGITYEMFLEKVNHHKRACLLYDPSHFIIQCLDYLQFIDLYHDKIKMFHVKDAEFNPTGKQGVYGGFQSWENRAGRFRSLGDGQVDFKTIFSKLTQYGFKGWAVLEWEDSLKDSQQGAKEGAEFIASHIIKTTDKAFDDFAASGVNEQFNKEFLGLD